MITLPEACDLLKRIKQMDREDDDEVAHSLEADLRVKVLHAVAHGHEHARELAIIALLSQGLNFARWYA